MALWMACADSGAGMVPSHRANFTALSNTSPCVVRLGLDHAGASRWLTSGADPW